MPEEALEKRCEKTAGHTPRLPQQDENTPRIARVSDTAFSSLQHYIEATNHKSDALLAARADAEEYRLNVPDDAVGRLATTLTAAAAHPHSAGAIAITPAAGVVGLYLMEGLEGKTAVTCIDPEADHQTRARKTFRDAGYRPTRARFLPSRPVDVLGRLATGSYQMVYVDAAPVDLPTIVHAAYPLLTPGGSMMIVDSLLDGTLADETRRDRDTEAAREADAAVEGLDNAVVARLPLGAGVTLVTRRRNPGE